VIGLELRPQKTPNSRNLILVAIAIAGIAGAASVAAARSPPAHLALRAVTTPAGTMVVTGSVLTVYVYLPDPTNPPATTCTGDGAHDWSPGHFATSAPIVRGINRTRIGVLIRPEGEAWA
jgi:predicted lipoprotein with Yx(FWY)xxD motif